MKKIFCSLLLMISMLLFCVPAFAKYNLTPSIALREEYNDNIFLDRTDEEEDYITTVSPSITFNYMQGKIMEFSLYYGLDFKYFDHHSYLNHDTVEDAQKIVFESHIKPSNFIFIDVFDRYEKVSIDLRKKTSSYNLHENMSNKNEFIVSPYVDLPLTNTFSVLSGYTYENIWYEDDSAVNYDNHSAFLTFKKKYTPRINGELKYEYIAHRPGSDAEKKYAGEVEYDRHDVSVAFDYKIRDDIKIKGEAGKAWFEYKDIENKQEPFWNVSIDNIFKFTEYTSLGVDYGIYFHDSTTSGATRNQELNLTFKTGKVLKLTLSPYYQKVKYITVEKKDRTAGVDAELSRPLTRKIHASIIGKWEKNEFLPEKEDVRRYNFGCDLDYALSRNIKISLGYRYENVEATSDIESADLEINDYDNNNVWLQAKIEF